MQNQLKLNKPNSISVTSQSDKGSRCVHNKSLPVPQEVISLDPAYIEISTTDTGIEFDGIVKGQSRDNNNNILVPF